MQCFYNNAPTIFPAVGDKNKHKILHGSFGKPSPPLASEANMSITLRKGALTVLNRPAAADLYRLTLAQTMHNSIKKRTA